ncbi:hypothetical protein [Actinacidiphila rubida]|uniref:Uncharacterized protein n=1 Tax=Actinacidiphila rubida TaxID=310780 RepID=A0A1H8SX84_9ACTN|nr:hypothetical protein [Actinacidiphila rubida]SEO82793.1 hypothetical protein SAMN05216267_10468 [Actinacidiphila rubida]
MPELMSMEKWLSLDPEGWRFQHVASGMRHDLIRFADGQPPTPFGCRWCGTPQHHHGRQYLRGRGMHGWEQPTNAQILARMQARRNTFKATCRCNHPWLHVDPWQCEADDCVMYERLLGLWLTPLSGREVDSLMGGA